MRKWNDASNSINLTCFYNVIKKMKIFLTRSSKNSFLWNCYEKLTFLFTTINFLLCILLLNDQDKDNLFY